MFTGIIEATGRITSIEKKGKDGRIVVESDIISKGVEVGSSIAVDGVCLTIVKITGSVFSADMSRETMNISTLGRSEIGSTVNLERALTPKTPIGGHIVTGHIDGIGRIGKKRLRGDYAELEIILPDNLIKYVIKKGSIAVDGISLTVAEVFDNGFTSSIIPHTLRNTTLLSKMSGEGVNIEVDIVAKYVERNMSLKNRSGITREFLSRYGYIKP